MNAASPGVLTKFVPDRYYQDEDAYVDALASALKEEYEAITRAGFILQIDAIDLGSARHNQYQHLSDEEFLRVAERNIAALIQATANIRRRRCACICAGAITKARTPRHPARQDTRRMYAGEAGRIVVRGGQSAPLA